MRTTISAFILGSTLLAACTADSSATTPGDDELAGEHDDGEAAKADAPYDTFGIMEAQKIGAFECNGLGSCTHVALNRANRSTTTCADGSTDATCSVRYLDFSKLHLTDSKLGKLTDALQAQAGNPDLGTQLLVRGSYKHGTNPIYPGVDWVTFQVSQVWLAQIADGNTEGTFVLTHSNGRECIDAPCASIDEARLNSSRMATTEGLDWSNDQESTSTHDDVETALFAAGAIVVGDRTHGSIMHLPTTLRAVSQAYLEVK
jgi:hypothetical protein